MVLPLSTCKSGPPKIVAVGTVTIRADGNQTGGLSVKGTEGMDAII